MGTSFKQQSPVTPPPEEGLWFPSSETDVALVRQQLDRLLADPGFSSSKRYPRLLRYIVEETLEGRGAQLKERTLGIEVFGREPSYDTNQDPVVRTSAAHVRQRIAQYYREARHEGEIRIELVPGSYTPQFRQPENLVKVPIVHEIAEPQALSANEVERTSPLVTPMSHFLTRTLALLAVAGAVALVFLAARARWADPDPVAKFWGPVWDNSDPIVICVPGKFPSEDAAAQQPMSIRESLRLNSIAWPDATTLFALGAFVQSHRQVYHIRRAGDSSLSDLRTGPMILVGGFNNSWLLRLNERLRFTYRSDRVENRPATEGWIQDAQRPEKRDWKVRWGDPYSSFLEDYGIISRVWDPTTERLVVTSSGIASYGTIAAGEFLTKPKYLAMIAEKAPSGWERKSIQVVFSTRVFNGNAGPPQILAIHVW
jgi:hypothetical protein